MNRLEALGFTVVISAGVVGAVFIGSKIRESHQEYKRMKEKKQLEERAFNSHKESVIKELGPASMLMTAVNTYSTREGVTSEDLSRAVAVLSHYESKLCGASSRSLFDACVFKFKTLCDYLSTDGYTTDAVNAIIKKDWDILHARAMKAKADEEHRREMDIQKSNRDIERMRAEIISDAIKSLKSDVDVNITNMLEGGENNG